MKIDVLSKELKEMYGNAYNGEFVAQIHIFGIKYGKLIREKGYLPKDIIEKAELNASYVTELNKGIKLSNFVSLPNLNLNSKELGNILKKEYETSEKGNSVASIHLFGIKYGKYIKLKNISINEIILISGLHISYLTELHKGIKLSEFVE